MSHLSIFNEFNTISTKDMSISEPYLIKTGTGVNSTYFKMNGSTKYNVYSMIGLKPKLSGDLYNLDSAIWSSIIDSKINDSEFDFADYKAIIFRGSIVDIVEKSSYDESIFDKFVLSLKKFSDSKILTCFFNSFDTMNLVFKKDKALVIASMNFNTGWYSVHSGICLDTTYILFPNAEIETSSFIEFMIMFNIDEFIDSATAMSIQDIETLGFDLDVNLSLREVLDILKDTRCSISLDEENYVASISGMSTDNSKIIVDFLNSFGSTYKSLKKLSFLRKVFKTGKISPRIIMKILSEEIGSEALNIHGYTLAKVSRICSTEEFDKKIIEEEIRK